MSVAHPGPSEIWASAADPGDISEPADGVKTAGYTGTPAPVYQFVNWLLKYLFQGIRHVLTHGIPYYSDDETYEVNDIVAYVGDGHVYRCIQAASGNLPSDPDYWTRWGHSAAEFPTGDADADSATCTEGTVSNATLQVVGELKTITVTVTGIGSLVHGTVITLADDLALSTVHSCLAAVLPITNHPNAWAQAEVTGANTITVSIHDGATVEKIVQVVIVGS